MKKILLVSACILIQGCISVSVSPVVSGTILNELGEPLDANVTITNMQLQKSQSVSTDKEGNYSFGKMRIWIFPIFSAILLRSEVAAEAEGYMPESNIIDSRNPATANFNLVAE
ncbi:carboxypeptidase-like regulatory domain-containing protein [Reinekea blandensis]|uniref:Carboxypeptidase regulatory-like domain-containing protein n=1 Tax=Reinekea blandensis MED297 TaxID=314283 RepID=A4BFB9_9GAMM|nr:carboxypeptidase-like regulatory domain-containing protein [Reinekea blandensis]EAR09232.1 hypothetical protein MED297_07113 [Reinekea sp. MED297] [Reinekea blandensis MED297]